MATRSTEAVRNGTDADGPGLLTSAFGERHAVPGTGSPMRWFFSGIWLVYLIQPVSALFGHQHGVAWIAGGLAITVAFCVIYLLVLMYSRDAAAAGAVRARGHRRAGRAGLRGVRQGLGAAVDLRVRRHRHGARDRARRAPGGHAGGRRGRRLLPVLLLGLPRRPREHPDRAAARPAHRAGHDGLPDADHPDARASPGPRDGRQAGRERGTAPAGQGHARPDRPVAVDDHAEVRAGRQAAGQAALLGRARRDPHRAR